MSADGASKLQREHGRVLLTWGGVALLHVDFGAASPAELERVAAGLREAAASLESRAARDRGAPALSGQALAGEVERRAQPDGAA